MSFRIPLRRKLASASIAIAWIASVAFGAEAQWPDRSASDLSIFVTLQRFQIYADYCSVSVPGLKPEFDGIMERLSRHIQRISKDLLSSDRFREMKDKPVPADIVFSFKDLLDDARHNFERRDAESVCPKTLQDLGEMDDESLKADLAQIFASVQNMIRNLEKTAAPQGAADVVVADGDG